jgi:hypothetical protein
MASHIGGLLFRGTDSDCLPGSMPGRAARILTMVCYVSAFQIDDLAIATFKEPDGEVICSGMWPCSQIDETVVVLTVDGEDLRVSINDQTRDPVKVGSQSYPGQHRVFWNGTAELDD